MGGVHVINLGPLHYSEWAEKLCSLNLSVHMTFDSPRVSSSTVDEWPGSVTIDDHAISVLFSKKDGDSQRRVYFSAESRLDVRVIEQILKEHNRIWGNVVQN